MIAELKPYPTMKGSGIPWLGEVPAHWEVRRLKTVCSRSALYGANVAATSYTTTGVRFLRTTDITEDGRLKSRGIFLPEKLVRDYLLADGDLLISRSGTIGRSFLYHPGTHGPCAYAGYLVRFVPVLEVLPKYIFLFTKTQAFAGFLRVMVISSTIENVNGEKYANSPLPLPPLSEQASIVRFLDHADRRIRRYIRAKQKLVQLLDEQKQAIIHQTVTGQINVRTGQPYPTYKDSGVEWLGKVPQHWEVRRNGRLFLQRNETGFPELPILEVSLNTGVRIRDFGNLDRKQIMAVRSEYKRAVKGDIAYNMMRMWQGAVGVIPVDGLVSPAYVVARLLKGTESQYFSTLFRTNVYMAEVDKYSHGIVRDRNRLYWEDFKQMPTSYPPPDEQGCIVRYLDKTTDDIDTAVARTRQEIDLLSEYRTRLIADVVTGKLDVRDAAAGLPEVDPLVEEDSDDTIDADMESNLDDRREVNR